MRVSVDTDWYLTEAQKLIAGRFPEGRAIAYLSYIGLLAVFISLKMAPSAILFIHFSAAIFALYCTYQLTFRYTHNSLISGFSMLLYVGWFKFQQWNLILYTDALFSHMVLISFYVVVYARSTKDYIAAISIVLFTALLHPTGLGLIIAILAFQFVKNQSIKAFPFRFKKLVFVLLAVISIWLVNAALYPFIDSILASYSAGEIIYPGINLYIDKPDEITISESFDIPILKLIYFISENPWYFIKLSCTKGLLYLAHIKPYYSWFHNIGIAVFLYPVYLLSLFGYCKLPNDGFGIMTAVFISFQILTVSFTSENWDGRFLLPILPPLFVLASIGSIHLILKLPKKDKSNKTL